MFKKQNVFQNQDISMNSLHFQESYTLPGEIRHSQESCTRLIKSPKSQNDRFGLSVIVTAAKVKSAE